MLEECLKILLAGLIVLAVGIPFVYFFDKWKKEMDEDGKENKK